MNARFLLFRPSPGFGRLLVALAPLFLSLTARAETNFTVIAMTNVWRYNETTNVDGTGWQQPGYDDSAWAAGPGMFGFENNTAIAPLIQTPLQDPLNYTPQGHCAYFRTRFDLPADPRGVILTLTNRIDDGAVFYLNGAELTRVRVTANPALFTSLANGTPPSTSDATADEIITLVPTNLVAGENVLAVSVHNSATTGTDLVIGCAVSAFLPDPIVITNQPQSQTAEVNSGVTFTVGVSGSQPSYQWQFKGANISGATAAAYTSPSVATSAAGDYRVIITNTFNRATSTVATLTVTADLTPPTLVSAVASETTNSIIVTFSENVRHLTATNVNNYVITRVGGTNRIVVTNAMNNARQVNLRVAPMWTPGNAYILTVNNVDDTYTNAIAPNSQIGIGMWQTLMESNVLWNWSEGFDLTGQDWTSPAYDESTNSVVSGGQWRIPDPAWNGVGRSTFYFYCFANPPSTSPGNTILSIGFPTYYFRAKFVIPPGTATNTTMRLNAYVDDGAIFHLNGAEIYRHNMPAGGIGYGTLATAQMSPSSSSSFGLAPFSASISNINLVTGTNILAVELHPASPYPSSFLISELSPSYEPGICFGASLRGTIAPDPSAASPSAAGLHSVVTLTSTQPPSAPVSSQPFFLEAPAAAPEGISNVIQISIEAGAALWIARYVSNSPAVFTNFYRLQTDGAFTYNARCDAGHSFTLANHTCMLVGRPVFQPTNMPPIQHGHSNYNSYLVDNGSTIHNFANTNVPYKASVFDVTHDHGLSTEFFVGSAIALADCERSYNAKYGAPDLIAPDNGRDKMDYSIVADSYADQLVSLYLQNLRFLPPKRFTFLHFADPDEAGHRYGWLSTQWSNSIVEVDRQIGRILNAVQFNPMLSNRTAIIVTADHGGDGTTGAEIVNHANPKSPTTFTIPLFLWGPGIPAGVDLYSLFSNRADPGTNWLDYTASPQPLRNGDTGNLALNLLGLPPIPGSLMIPKFAWDEPSLALHNTNAALVVSWSGYATNFQLEASASLEAAAPWTPVMENITAADDRFTHAVNAAPGGNRFYRLRKTAP